MIYTHGRKTDFKNTIRVILLFIIIFMTFGLAKTCQAKPSLNHSLDNSFKVIGNSMLKGQWSGSAFAYKDYIVTNRHVVKDATVIRLVNFEGKVFRVKKLDISDKYDLALLELKNPMKYTGIPACLSSARALSYNIYNVGNPKGMDFIYTEGYIAGLSRKLPYFKTDSDFLIHNLVGTSGQSGSAVIDSKKHCVISVLTGYSNNAYMGFSIPVETLNKYIEEYEAKKSKKKNLNL